MSEGVKNVGNVRNVGDVRGSRNVGNVGNVDLKRGVVLGDIEGEGWR